MARFVVAHRKLIFVQCYLMFLPCVTVAPPQLSTEEINDGVAGLFETVDLNGDGEVLDALPFQL